MKNAILTVIIIALALAFALYGVDTEYRNVSGAMGGTVMRIDGNKNGTYVIFSHKKHGDIAFQRGGGCALCHHLGTPAGKTVPCSRCHMKMNTSASMFGHQAHANLYKAGNYCDECHPGGDRSKDKVRACISCHSEYGLHPSTYYTVPSYVDSLHTQCSQCHNREGIIAKKNLAMDCYFCH